MIKTLNAIVYILSITVTLGSCLMIALQLRGMKIYITVLDFQKKSWGQLAPKFSFFVARTSILWSGKIIFKN